MVLGLKQLFPLARRKKNKPAFAWRKQAEWDSAIVHVSIVSSWGSSVSLFGNAGHNVHHLDP